MTKITVIGGGTGSYTVLNGLKHYDIDLAAIVSTADSGGSSGKLRDEFGVLPPGDLRRCLVALSERRGDIWRRLFEYRFDGERENNNLGNLIITALTRISGDLPGALHVVSDILEVKGSVLPATLDKSHLCADLTNGQKVTGESNIDIPIHDANVKISRVYLEPRAFAYKKAVERILDSQIIVLGPGDLYTSVIPNLLVEGIAQAISQSRAKKVYVANIMTKHGETDSFRANDFVAAIEKHLGATLDYVILNNKRPTEEIALSYREEQSYFVEPVLENFRGQTILADLIDEKPFVVEAGKKRPLIRHDSEKLARAIMELI